MPQSFLAWPLALERPRVFFNQHQTAVTLSPPSLLMAWRWRLSKASSTLEMWYQVMDNLTRKSLQGSVRQAKLLEDSAKGCSHTKMCSWPQSWKSTELLSSHHCSMAVSPDYLPSSHQAAGEVPYVSTPFHPGYPTTGQYHQSQSLDQTSLTSNEVMLLKAQLCWTGHIIWMGDECIPKQLFFGEIYKYDILHSHSTILFTNQQHIQNILKTAQLWNMHVVINKQPRFLY